MAEKYYWLKLKKDFFKRHDIRIIEEMSNGKEYILFYLKLLVESISHNGELRFSDTIPYNEEMLSTITNTNVDIVRNAMKIFHELKMIDILDNNTIFMNEVNTMLGAETEWAVKKREYREQKLLSEGTKKDIVRQEKEKEKEKDIEKDIYLLLLNKYRENKPKNYADKVLMIKAIRDSEEYNQLSDEEQNQLFNEMMKGGEL